MTSFAPSAYGMVPYGAADVAYPCIRKGAQDKASNGAVSAVQAALMENMGLDPAIESDARTGLALTGVFDDATDLAVRELQNSKGFAMDGVVGPVTGAALGLKFQSCSGGFSQTAAPTDPAPKAPTLLERAQVLWLTQPGLVVGGAILAVVAPTIAYVYYRNTR